MEFRKITAIINPYNLKKVEDALLDLGVPGATVSKVKGYGEYANFFAPDWLVNHVKVEIFIGKHRADEIARLIMEIAHSGSEGDGIIAISPVETIYHIRTKQKCRHDVCD
jgi:nitrogen regulatory protein P-II 1